VISFKHVCCLASLEKLVLFFVCAERHLVWPHGGMRMVPLHAVKCRHDTRHWLPAWRRGRYLHSHQTLALLDLQRLKATGLLHSSARVPNKQVQLLQHLLLYRFPTQVLKGFCGSQRPILNYLRDLFICTSLKA